MSPVWYALLSYRDYVWVSRPGTRHSRNLAARPEVAIAIYDSHRPGGWSAFYMAAVAEELEDVDVALEAFNRRSEAQGLRAWSRVEVVSRGDSGSTAPPPASSSFSTATTGGFRFTSSSATIRSIPAPSLEQAKEGTSMQELLVDFITSLDGYGAAEGWPGWWGLQGPEYLAWLGEQPERDYTILMGANTYRLMSGICRPIRGVGI